MVKVLLDKIKKFDKDTRKPILNFLYLDGFLEADLKVVQDRVLNHNDFWLLILDGRPGTGKSTLGTQIACRLNQTHSINSICFNLEQFEHVLKSANEGDVVVLDEAFELNVRSSQSRANLRILSLLQQAREKKIFVILILVCTYDLDKNVVLSLCDYFIHCWREPFGPRGQYNAYDPDGLKNLYLWGRQTRSYSYKIAKAIYPGRFTKNFVLDYLEYRKKKITTLESTRKNAAKKQASSFIRKAERNKIIRSMHAKGINVDKICDMLDIQKSAIYKILKEHYTKVIEIEEGAYQNETETTT